MINSFGNAVSPLGRQWLSSNRFNRITGSAFVSLCEAESVEIDDKTKDYLISMVESLAFDGVTVFMTTVSDWHSKKSPPDVHGLAIQLTDKLLGIVPEDTLKLRLSLVPKKLHTLNLRKAMAKKNWQSLRENLIAKRGPVCAICGSVPSLLGELDTHEVWKYDTSRRPNRAVLEDIILACGDCHSIIHFGITAGWVAQGKLPEERIDYLSRHFCAVNKVSSAMFDFHVASSFNKWNELNRKKAWYIDLTRFSSEMNQQEALAFKNFEKVT